MSERVERALTVILEEIDVEELDAGERAAVEHSCQSIHAKFGGEGPESIYPDEDGVTVYDEVGDVIERWRTRADRVEEVVGDHEEDIVNKRNEWNVQVWRSVAKELEAQIEK